MRESRSLCVVAFAAALLVIGSEVRAQDADGDGVPDSSDNCVDVVNPLQVDDDGDMVGDACDCRPDESSAAGLLGPARGLVFNSASGISWQAPGTGPVDYDLLRATSVDLTLATCLESDEPDLMALDTEEPASGQVFFYALRAQSACGGNAGTDHLEQRRPAGACPAAALVGRCTEAMDASCPNVAPVCGDVAFSGGVNCLREFLGNCYDTGIRAYKVTQAAPLTIDFAADVTSVDLFFAEEVGTVLGSMRFFDVDHLEVDAPLGTNGVCSGAVMPPRQNLDLSRPVRRIEVEATGAGDVWIDTFTVNPNAFLPSCVENMDATCPNVSPLCGATFSGGSGCATVGIGNCYDTGIASYLATAASPLTILFDGGVSTLDVFFSHQSAGTTGTMRFFDDAGLEVDGPIVSNGPCAGLVMPPTQFLTFSRPVRRIEVSVAGAGNVWIDSFAVNP